jgi:NAD(P)-dependent dehydrogenase (short-subunit alcohol dehydrogenase family)
LVSVRIVETMNLDKIRRCEMSFAGQRVVVIGGSSGIGEATARGFAAAGADVVITGRAKTRLDAAVGRTGHPIRTGQFDATDAAAVSAFFSAEGPVDHLVLAASSSSGSGAGGPFADLEAGALRDAFEGKFFVYFNVLKAAAVRQSVTLITAGSARAAFPGTAGLAAVNGAIEAMVPPLAAELAPVRVNAVSPGVIDTPWWHAMPEEQRDTVFQGTAASVPVRRVGQAGDVAGAVLYLAGAGFVTGTVLECTGGATLATGTSLA